MKETLRQRIESELKAIRERVKQLDRHVNEYSDAANYMDAAISKIKRDTLDLVIVKLEDALAQC